MSDGLNNFLDSEEGVSPAVEPVTNAEADTFERVPEPEPEPVAQAEPEPAAAAEPAEAEPEEAPGRMVAARVMLEERKRRQRLEGEAAELRRQLEEARKPPAAPPEGQPQQPTWVNPAEDPQGFLVRTQEVMISERLNISEMITRKEVGDEVVERATAEFKQAAQQDPGLYQRLYTQQNPYGWVVKEMERRRLANEIGDDPAAYRERLRKEIEAEVRGQVAQPAQEISPPRVSPVAGLQPSLARARSVAARTVVDESDEPLGAIFRR
jgi:hypothetical protein